MYGFIKSLPMLITFILTYIILIIIDRKYSLINKVNSKIKVKYQWRSLVYTCFTFIMIFFIGVIGMYIINISERFYFIICGFLIGVMFPLAFNFQRN